MSDPSNGYDAASDDFVAIRSDAGHDVVAAFASRLTARARVIDIGAGAGEPVTRVLRAAGLRVWAIDASPNMVAAFATRFPDIPVACEDATQSAFFDRRFDAALCIGLIFLLEAEAQRQLIARVAGVLDPGGRFLFSAPWQTGTWADTLTGLPSRSLGRAQYRAALADAGFEAITERDDAQGNHYFEAVRAQ